MDFRNLYMPLIAGNKNSTYIEKAASVILAPYIRCYWYCEDLPDGYDNLIIPDTCVDIVFSVDRKDNVTVTFCGVNDKPYYEYVAASFKGRKVFAVRFYVWSFSLFCKENMQGTRNEFCDAESYLRSYVKETKKILSSNSRFDEFINISDKLLTEQLNKSYQDNSFMNAIFEILKNKGNIRVNELAVQCFIGERQLERLFHARMDLSPKQFADLIRYQNAWREILFNQRLDVNELVFQLGYTDQSHLLKKFKKYHGITPHEAKKFAYGVEKVASQIIKLS